MRMIDEEKEDRNQEQTKQEACQKEVQCKAEQEQNQNWIMNQEIISRTNKIANKDGNSTSYKQNKTPKGAQNKNEDKKEKYLFDKFQSLVCRKYNLEGCFFKRCRWLHVCDKFLLGECLEGDNCTKNHTMLFAHEKDALDQLQAGYNTEKKDYRTQVKNYKKDENSEQTKQDCNSKEQQNVPRNGNNSNPSRNNEQKLKGCRSNERTNYVYSDVRGRKQAEEVNNDITLKGATNKPEILDEICRNNIKKRCKYDENCSRYHYDLPYQWQYKVPTRQWENFQEVVNETLEMNYCNIDIDTAIVSLAFDQCIIDFKQMKGKMKEGDIWIRCLSTNSYCEAPPGETLVTQWKWYWRNDDGIWQQYSDELYDDTNSDKDISTEIEENYIEDRTKVFSIQIGNFQYQVDLKYMKQINTKTKKERDIKRRPLFKSRNDVEKEAMEKIISRRRGRRQVQDTKPDKPSFPAHWLPMSDDNDDMTRVNLTKTCKEFKDVLSAFKTSIARSNVVVSTIERIQNPFLWQNYSWKRYTMEKQSQVDGANEKTLYHGTTKENIEPICRNNFDWRLYGTTVGNIYGQGSYFAVNAKYSDSGYATFGHDGLKSMFVVKALVGKYTKGTSGLRRPPPLELSDPKGKLFDSTVDNLANPKVFCLFHDSQYYPEYLIRYK